MGNQVPSLRLPGRRRRYRPGRQEMQPHREYDRYREFTVVATVTSPGI